MVVQMLDHAAKVVDLEATNPEGCLKERMAAVAEELARRRRERSVRELWLAMSVELARTGVR